MRDPSPLPPAPDYLDYAAARRIILGILITMLLAALDQVMVATALPTIGRSFDDFDNLSWIITANLLCSTAVTPLYGKLSDIRGRRAMLLIAIGIYAAGSLWCALSSNLLTLIFGRGLQGLGGGGLMPLVQTIIGDVASPRDRPRYQAYTSSTFIVSTVGGPLLGGYIAQHFHWSWIFWLNLPLCALAYVLTHNVLQRLPRHERPHQLDVLGAALLVGAAMPLMLALNWSGRHYGWNAAETMTLCAVSAAFWVLFACRVTWAGEPFIPVAVLRDRAMRGGTIAGFFSVGMVLALTMILPLYAQLVLGLSVSASAWTLVAVQGGATLSSIVGGRMLVWFARYKRVPLIGLLLSIAALIPLVLAPAGFSPITALALLALAGFGLGPMFPFTVVVVQNAAASHDLGIATGAMNFFRALGATFIVAFFGALVLAGVPSLAAASPPGAAPFGGDPAQGFRLVFAAAILCLLVALAAVLVLEERPLRGAKPAASAQ
jgi:MFS family permease